MYFSMREKVIMAALSENARATITELAKIAKCSRPTARRIVERLEKELELKFTLEVDPSKLGTLERHIIAIKFKEKPNTGALESFFSKEKYVHDVYLTEGQFDLVVIATASNPVDYIIWETRMIEELSDYTSSIKPSGIAFLNFGFIPLNDGFVEDISKDIKVDAAERHLLKLLNNDSRMSYQELSKLTGISENMARYKVFGLRKKGIIKRFTVAAQRPPQKYVLSFFENWVYKKDFDNRAAVDRKEMMDFDKETALLTTYQFSAPLTGGFGNFALALFEDKSSAVQDVIERHKVIYRRDSLGIAYARVIRALKGLLPFRNLDVRKNYMVVRWL